MSDFGRGLCYCLGLFLKHWGELGSWLSRYEAMRKTSTHHPELFTDERAYHLWFYGAADHFSELADEAGPTPEIRERLKILKAKALHWRLPMGDEPYPKKEDYLWVVSEATELLLLIDKALGVDATKGRYE